jgi:hypothetical protein
VAAKPYWQGKALHAQPAVFRKGRAAGSLGAPVTNPTVGPVFTQLNHPVQARRLPARPGAATWRQGIYSPPPPPPPPILTPGVITVAPARQGGAVITVAPAGQGGAVMRVATTTGGQPGTWPPQPDQAFPVPSPLIPQ